MRERKEIVLSGERGLKKIHYTLPPYVVLVWYSEALDQICEAEVHPAHVTVFKANQEKFETKGVIWEKH